MRPGDLTAGPDGNLWFPESSSSPTVPSKIGRITPAGAIAEVPLPMAGSYQGSLSLTVGPDGNLWFSGQFGRAIGRIAPSGAIAEFRLPAVAGSLTVGPDGNLWFPDGVGIGRVDPIPPRVTKVVAIANSSKAIASILLGFDEALNPSSASKGRFYGLAAGVASGPTIVFSRGVKNELDAPARHSIFGRRGTPHRSPRWRVGLVWEPRWRVGLVW
jgi:hypothetical protein